MWIGYSFSILERRNNESYPFGCSEMIDQSNTYIYTNMAKILVNKKPYNTSFTLVFENYPQHNGGLIYHLTIR